MEKFYLKTDISLVIKANLALISLLIFGQLLSAQEVVDVEKNAFPLGKLQVSGYVQTQFQYGEKDASLSVGSGNENPEKSFARFGVRRGRIKLAYEKGIASSVFQIDLTEKGINIKDVYLNLKDPWIKTNALRAGIFNRPFGHETAYFSSLRESSELSAVFRALFPQEFDLGAMLTLQSAKTSPIHFLKIQAAVVAGNGIKPDTDNRKDFIGQLTMSNKIGDSFKYRVGVSYYNGGVYQGTNLVYKMKNNAFTLSGTDNKGKFAKREYFGFDAQLSLTSVLGLTQLRGEYLFGTQPGTKTSSKSPNYSVLQENDTYIRNFSGAYAILTQNIGTTPFAAVAKYDWYDPNVNVSGDEVGLTNGTGEADASQQTLGVGALWNATEDIRLTVYYDFVFYEKVKHVAALSDRKADIFTMRLQYKF